MAARQKKTNKKEKQKIARAIGTLVANLHGVAQTRKFETFGKRVQKEGVGPGSGNCKATYWCINFR